MDVNEREFQRTLDILKGPIMIEHVDCDETNWQTTLVIGGVRRRYSQRAALQVLAKEEALRARGKDREADNLMAQRQRG